MLFELTILGCNAAIPAHGRHPTAQLLQVDQQYFLIDCGEGTQMQLARYRVRATRLHYVLVSHLHGDHYQGLIGLLSTLHLLRRTEELHVFGPAGLADILTIQLKYSDTRLGYPLHFHPVDTTVRQVILDTPHLTVETIPLVHRVPCAGYLFREKPKKRRLRKEALPEGISIPHLHALKKGQDVLDADGRVLLRNADYTLPPRRRRSYAFCSDTCYLPELADQLAGVDLLYHESTFLDEDAPRAAETCHSTAGQAATLARDAGVGRLLLGHYSSRYKDLTPFLDEARGVFAETYLAVEGETLALSDAEVAQPA